MDFKDKNGWQNWSGSQSGMSDGMLKRLWDASGNYKQSYQPDVATGLQAFKQKMAEESNTTQVVPMRPKRNYLLRIAAGLAILAIGILVFKGQLSSNDELQVISAPENDTIEKTLPDGSQIALNQQSELSYSSDFAAQERRVKLKGEAFFDVRRDEAKPFIIEAAEAKITVLGTSFNVRAYPKEDVVVVYVVSGKVSVEIEGAGKPKLLLKGDVMKFNRQASKMEFESDDAGIPIAWHSGVLNFKGKPIPFILDGMAELYGIDFNLKSSPPNGCLQTLTVQEGKLDDAISALKLLCPELQFEKTSNGNYTVSGTCCQ